MTLLTNHFVSDLKKILTQTLPGTKAQFLMAPDPIDYYNRFSTDYREAAVLALIYPIADQLHLVFMERTSNDEKDKHAGQISFPGGKLEESDKSLKHCALREAKEEVGIEPDQVQILGKLSKVFVFVSNFMVYPYVGFSEKRPNFIKDTDEVSEILEVPIADLINESNHKKKDLTIRNYILKDVPYYAINDHVLWGATAMITSELMYLINEIT